MEKAYVFLAEGFEEMEALGTVDILRRAGVQVKTVSITGCKTVSGAHGIPVESDELFEAVSDYDGALILPGGIPGATNLADHEGLLVLLRKHAEENKWIAAICAAPLVLGKLGLLQGKKATCYLGFEGYLTGAEVTGANVVTDGKIITGKGPGLTFDFALTIVGHLCGSGKVRDVKEGMLLA